MRTIVLFILLIALSASGQQSWWNAVSANQAQVASGGGGGDTLSAMNPNFVWLSSSLASGAVNTDWVDLSNSVPFKVYSAGSAPTNSTASDGGLWFFGNNANCALTNNGISINNGGKWWAAWCIPISQQQLGTGCIGTDNAGANGIYDQNTQLNAFFSGAHGIPALTSGVRYNLMVSCTSGTLTAWTNGVLLGTASIGTATWTLQNIGNDGGYTTGDDPLQGRIQKFVLATNVDKTITDAQTWNTYCTAHNP